MTTTSQVKRKGYWHCKRCDGTNISVTATGTWDFTEQKFVYTEDDAGGDYCVDCGEDSELVFKEVPINA